MSVRRSLLAVAVSLVLAYAANLAAQALFRGPYGDVATDQFLYYWLPNQLTVFTIGFVGFHLVRRPGGLPGPHAVCSRFQGP